MSNNIDHPSHYTQGNVETIEIIKAMTENLTGFEGYLVGNVCKYLSRYPYKNGVEDIKKSAWYLQRLIDEQEPTKEYKPEEMTTREICDYLDTVREKLDDFTYTDSTGEVKKLGLG